MFFPPSNVIVMIFSLCKLYRKIIQQLVFIFQYITNLLQDRIC